MTKMTKKEQLLKRVEKTGEKVKALRTKLDPLKEEYASWERKIHAVDRKNLHEIIEEYKQWEESSGYAALRNDISTAEEAYRASRKAYEEYVEKMEVAEEKKEIKASGLKESEYRFKQALKEFGVTSDFREAGYLLPNGQMLNFSGEKGKHYGQRGMDHRGIGIIYASRACKNTEAMIAFMKEGSIRLMAETPGIDIIKEPTKQQYSGIIGMARRFSSKEFFSVDLTDENGNTVGNLSYEGRVSPERVVRDIKRYFTTGVVPEQNDVVNFL